MAAPTSVHDAEPLERGGVVARQGFAYQDHVAVAFLLQMLDDQLLAAVWCEAADDITLIWRRDEGDAVEYVQVKRSELDQLWTAAKLCEPSRAGAADRGSAVGDGAGNDDGNGAGSPANGNGTAPRPPKTLVEKSLANDRCTEPCTFRVVSAWPIHAALRTLALPLDHAHRQPGHEAIEAVVEAIRKQTERRGHYTSPNGNDAEFWVRRVVWEVRESAEAVENHNARTLDDYVYRTGGFLAPDQRRELYARLLALVRAAADADWLPDPGRKKLQRAAIVDFVAEAIGAVERPMGGAPGGGLQGKLTAAGFAQAVIDEAFEIQRQYRREVLTPRYLSVADRELVEDEVAARLHRLRAGLDAGVFTDPPATFHHRCLEELEALRGDLPIDPKPRLVVLQGAMYDLTHRCLHRFVRTTAPVLAGPARAESRAPLVSGSAAPNDDEAYGTARAPRHARRRRGGDA